MADDSPGPILLVGEGDLADEVRAALDALGADVVRMVAPVGREVRQAFERGGIPTAIVMAHDDALALRYALMIRDADADVELLVSYFDHGTSEELCERIGNCRITSVADIAAPVLAAACLDADLGAVRIEDGRLVGLVHRDGDRVEEVEVDVPRRHRLRPLLRAIFRPYDKSAALLLYGALGLVTVLLIETFTAAAVLHQNVIDSFYGAAKTLVTVDPNDKVADGPKWFKVFVSVLMLVVLLFEAFFTAGIVNRLINRRLTGLVGKRAVPRLDHVIVVGLGQVGLRLAMLLRECGLSVVAVDHQEDGENVGVAREAGLPVVIGRGGDPSLLRRLSLHRAHALAAVTDDDLENLSIAMSVRAAQDDLRTVIRVGDGKLANETRSLFTVGIVRDVHRIAAGLIAAQATGSGATGVICRHDEAHLVHADGAVEEAAIAAASSD